MQAPPTVALGAKDKRSASLGQRVRMHFYNNRGAYAGLGGLTLGVLAGESYIKSMERRDPHEVYWTLDRTPSGRHEINSHVGTIFGHT